MSYKYRILRKPFQQAPPSPEMREQVKKDLCGNTDGFVMLQTSMRYSGEPPSSQDYTLQEEYKICNPVSCHSYLFDYCTNFPEIDDSVFFELVITYQTPEGPREEIVKIKPDQNTLYVPTLLLTFYPYDVNNPNDTSYYTYSFSTTNLQKAIEGEDTNRFNTTDKSPDANNGRWILSTSTQNDPMIPSDLCYSRYYIFNKRYSDYSFHIRTVIGVGNQTNPPLYVYTHVIHLLPVYYDSRYRNPLRLFNEVRERTLPPPYS